MGARIVVSRGRDADKGREAWIGSSDELRIGWGHGWTWSLSDEALGIGGYLGVRYRDASFVAENRLGVTVYYHHGATSEPSHFASGSTRAWYDGDRIQLSADTDLILTMTPDVPQETPPRVVPRGETTEEARKSKDHFQLILIAMLLPLAIFLHMPAPEEAEVTASPQQVRARYDRVCGEMESLGRIEPAPGTAPPHGRWAARALREELRQARLAELSGREREAMEHYQHIGRELLQETGVLSRYGPPGSDAAGAEQVFRDARDFVNQRLVDLGERRAVD